MESRLGLVREPGLLRFTPVLPVLPLLLAWTSRYYRGYFEKRAEFEYFRRNMSGELWILLQSNSMSLSRIYWVIIYGVCNIQAEGLGECVQTAARASVVGPAISGLKRLFRGSKMQQTTHEHPLSERVNMWHWKVLFDWEVADGLNVKFWVGNQLEHYPLHT